MILRNPRLKKGAAILLSSCVHAGLLWLLATRLAGDLPPPAEAKGAAGDLRLFTVAPPSPEPRATEAATAPVAPTPDVDVSAESELPPPEWAIVRIAASRVPAAAPRSEAAAAAPAGAGTFDPYAGASLIRRDAAEAPAAAPFALDEAAFAELVRRARQAAGESRGSIEYLVQVSRTGRVLAVRAVGGTAGERAKSNLARQIVGRTLFRPTGAGRAEPWLRLPPIRLG